MVGADGFEPSISRSQTGRCNQTELCADEGSGMGLVLESAPTRLQFTGRQPDCECSQHPPTDVLFRLWRARFLTSGVGRGVGCPLFRFSGAFARRSLKSKPFSARSLQVTPP
jgi:hypothetical protein